MVATISRDELKLKIDQRDKFLLVETLPKRSYQHAHLPGAINLPPNQVTQLAFTLLPDKTAEIVVYTTMPEVSRTGLMLDYLPRVSTSIWIRVRSNWQSSQIGLAKGAFQRKI